MSLQKKFQRASFPPRFEGGKHGKKVGKKVDRKVFHPSKKNEQFKKSVLGKQRPHIYKMVAFDSRPV